MKKENIKTRGTGASVRCVPGATKSGKPLAVSFMISVIVAACTTGCAGPTVEREYKKDGYTVQILESNYGATSSINMFVHADWPYKQCENETVRLISWDYPLDLAGQFLDTGLFLLTTNFSNRLPDLPPLLYIPLPLDQWDCDYIDMGDFRNVSDDKRIDSIPLAEIVLDSTHSPYPGKPRTEPIFVTLYRSTIQEAIFDLRIKSEGESLLDVSSRILIPRALKVSMARYSDTSIVLGIQWSGASHDDTFEIIVPPESRDTLRIVIPDDA